MKTAFSACISESRLQKEEIERTPNKKYFQYLVKGNVGLSATSQDLCQEIQCLACDAAKPA